MTITRMLRRAMEDRDDAADSEKTVVMKGPLAEIFTKALNVAYAKPDPVTGEVKMESQEQDAKVLQAKMSAMAALVVDKPPEESTTNAGGVTLYGVPRDQISDDDIVAVTQDLANTRPENGRFILIVDGTKGGTADTDLISNPEMVRMESAMESLVKAHGGRVFHSLEEYVRRR